MSPHAPFNPAAAITQQQVSPFPNGGNSPQTAALNTGILNTQKASSLSGIGTTGGSKKNKRFRKPRKNRKTRKTCRRNMITKKCKLCKQYKLFKQSNRFKKKYSSKKKQKGGVANTIQINTPSTIYNSTGSQNQSVAGIYTKLASLQATNSANAQYDKALILHK
jgi:hypothetical protein